MLEAELWAAHWLSWLRTSSASSGAPVVVVEAAKHGQRHDSGVGMARSLLKEDGFQVHLYAAFLLVSTFLCAVLAARSCF